MKEWTFVRPLSLLVIKPHGKHYAVQTEKGWVEKDENIIVTRAVNNVQELKTLRNDIRKGKYYELASSPICDQLWAAIAHKTGFLRIIDKEEEDDEA